MTKQSMAVVHVLAEVKALGDIAHPLRQCGAVIKQRSGPNVLTIQCEQIERHQPSGLTPLVRSQSMESRPAANAMRHRLAIDDTGRDWQGSDRLHDARKGPCPVPALPAP